MKRGIAGFLAGIAMTAGAEPALRVEAELTPAQVRVQAQAIYTLRAWQSADLRDIRLVGPQSTLADVHALGATRMRVVEREGRRYRLHERSFAILPFASGSLELTGAHVSGRPPAAAAAIRLDAPARSLSVQAVPAGIAADRWLPAQQIALSETWSPGSGALPHDGVMQRTIRIEARGVAAVQIPELIPEIPGMRVRPLPPRLENRIEDNALLGVREQGFQLLPLQTGTVAVPALQLAWWKVSAGETAIATLPPRSLVLGDPATDPAGTPPPRMDASAPPPNPVSNPLPDSPSGEMRQLVLIGAGAGLLLALSGAVWLAARLRHQPLRDLRRACAGDDPINARKALLAWAGRIWPTDPPQSLPAMAARLAAREETARALAELDRHCYGTATRAWQGENLWRLMRRSATWHRQVARQQEQGALL